MSTKHDINLLQPHVFTPFRYRYINIIWFCCDWLAMSNSCYNPFIYGIYNVRNTGFLLYFVLCSVCGFVIVQIDLLSRGKHVNLTVLENRLFR
jgi:hypothetical protein